VTSLTIGETRYKSGQSHKYQLSPSRVTSEGVVFDEYIGEYVFCHSDCPFILHFWNKLAENNNFDV